MKFGKVFEEKLKESEIPESWISNGSINYKKLKKSLSKLVKELEEIGVLSDIKDLRMSYSIGDPNKDGQKHVSPVLTMNISDKDNTFEQLIEKLDELQYNFNLTNIDEPVIELVEANLSTHTHDDNKLSYTSSQVRRDSISKEEDTKVEVNEIEDIESLKTNTNENHVIIGDDSHDFLSLGSLHYYEDADANDNNNDDDNNNNNSLQEQTMRMGNINIERDSFLEEMHDDNHSNGVNVYSFEVQSQFTNDDSSIIDARPLKWYELNITLHEDIKFFEMLNKEIELFEGLKVNERQGSIDKIEEVSQLISKTTSPNIRRSDMYIWREIFQLYIDSEIFFTLQNTSKNGVKFSVSKVEEINNKYLRFLEKVKELKLADSFKKKNSVKAFLEFKLINQTLIKLLIFENLNSLAVYKILKKFNKQTIVLNANSNPNQFQDFYINKNFIKSASEGSISPFIVKDLCSVLTMRLLNLTPQIDDYTCPICCQVAFKPIRLHCGHLFCVRCLIKLQRKSKDQCPLCRDLTVMKADETNLDKNTLDFIKLYFPKEIKEKREDDEKEIFKEQFGEIIDVDQKCTVV